ncbi:hypothetical protein KPP2020_078 [Klebsiella phage KPP2020]|uniref:Uncharacterized protein n=1 Tax=Klebsiella phage KPP2020 TaxID=3017288 RepID=A0AAE9YAI8_9CAUD|nr:hypothetical protein KPP2020_078 [Klebsiella phage KPP2020]
MPWTVITPFACLQRLAITSYSALISAPSPAKPEESADDKYVLLNSWNMMIASSMVAVSIFFERFPPGCQFRIVWITDARRITCLSNLPIAPRSIVCEYLPPSPNSGSNSWRALFSLRIAASVTCNLMFDSLIMS